MGKHKKGPGNIPLTVWLGYLLAVTFLVTGVTFSSYITTTSGGDSARVARWSVDIEGDERNMILIKAAPGIEVHNDLVVYQNSEVSVEYVIRIENLTDNLPLQFAVREGNGALDFSDVGEVYTYTSTLPPNAGKVVYDLVVKWPGDKNSDLTLIGMVDALAVDVTMVQLD